MRLHVSRYLLTGCFVALLWLWPLDVRAQLNLRGVDDADTCFIENSKGITSRESWAAIVHACRMRFPFRFLRNKEYEFDCTSYTLRFDTKRSIVTVLSGESPQEGSISRISPDEIQFGKGVRITSNSMLIMPDGKSFQCSRKGVMG